MLVTKQGSSKTQHRREKCQGGPDSRGFLPGVLHGFKSRPGQPRWCLALTLALWSAAPQVPETMVASNAHNSRKTEQTLPGAKSASFHQNAPYFWLPTVPNPKRFPPQGQNEQDNCNFKIKTLPVKQ